MIGFIQLYSVLAFLAQVIGSRLGSSVNEQKIKQVPQLEGSLVIYKIDRQILLLLIAFRLEALVLSKCLWLLSN